MRALIWSIAILITFNNLLADTTINCGEEREYSYYELRLCNSVKRNEAENEHTILLSKLRKTLEKNALQKNDEELLENPNNFKKEDQLRWTKRLKALNESEKIWLKLTSIHCAMLSDDRGTIAIEESKLCWKAAYESRVYQLKKLVNYWDIFIFQSE